MPACSHGHESAATDYCDVCGVRLDGPARAAETGPSALLSSAPVQLATRCPQCGAPGISRFCEACGYSAESPAAVRPVSSDGGPASPRDAPRQTTWTAVITASRSRYEAMLAAGGLCAEEVPFPDDYPERTIPLSGSQLRIGRRSVSREVRPEIDVTGPPGDPAISRLHAVLVGQRDGSWAVIDPGSENGTSVNGAEVDVGDLVPLHDGDVIGIGAWTVITIEAAATSDALALDQT